MEQFEYTFTVGMDRQAIDERLQTAEIGVLSLADGDDAYGIPLAYHWDGESFVFRLGDHPASDKMAFIDSTDRASFLVFEYRSPEDSWSVLATGRLRPLEQAESEALEAREGFIPLRLFGEAVADVEPRLFRLQVEALTGRMV